jgi:hypothetical protein
VSVISSTDLAYRFTAQRRRSRTRGKKAMHGSSHLCCLYVPRGSTSSKSVDRVLIDHRPLVRILRLSCASNPTPIKFEIATNVIYTTTDHRRSVLVELNIVFRCTVSGIKLVRVGRFLATRVSIHMTGCNAKDSRQARKASVLIETRCESDKSISFAWVISSWWMLSTVDDSFEDEVRPNDVFNPVQELLVFCCLNQ